MAAPQPDTIGPYTILGELGRGGMGVVYRALDPALGRDIALKVLPDTAPQEMRERFLREGRVAARLRHPNIVSILAAGEDDGMAWLAQDLIEGRALDAVLHDEALTHARAAELVEKIARAVAHAHAEGVIHRDIKPANILVDAAGTPFLADFGLARDVEGTAKLSKSGQVYGTAHYMSPEQARGMVGGLDGRTDVWALGVVLYDCLTNALPFEGETAVAVLARVINDEPRSLHAAAPDVPTALGVIVTKCLEKEPRRRYSTADALADDLARWARGEAILAKPPTLRFRLGRWSKRNRRGLLLGAGLTALSLGLAGVFVVPQLRESARQRDAAAKARDEAETRAQTALRERALEAERLERARPHLDRGRRILARLDRLLGQNDWTRKQLNALSQEARDEFELALEAYPRHPDAMLEIARSWLLLSEHVEAIKSLHAAARAHPANTRIRLARGVLCMHRYAVQRGNALGRPMPETEESAKWRAGALEDLAFVESNGADEAELEFAGALLAFVTGDAAGAAPRLQAYAERRLTDAEAWSWAAYAWITTGRFKKSEAVLTRLLQLRPRDVMALSRRGVARHNLGDRAGAEADYERIFTITTTFAPAYINRGALRWARGDAAGAVADYDRAIALRDDDAVAFNNRAAVHLNLGNLEQSLADFSRAIELVPNYAEAFANRARLHIARGDFEQALADCDRALEINPTFINGWLRRADVHRARGDTEAEERELRAAMQAVPGNAELVTAAGDLAAQRKDLRGALKHYHRALELEPRYFPARMNLGVTQMRLGDYAAAEASFSTAIPLRPAFWSIWKNRGLVRALLKQYEGSLADLRKAVALTKPGSPERQDAEHWLGRITANANRDRGR